MDVNDSCQRMMRFMLPRGIPYLPCLRVFSLSENQVNLHDVDIASRHLPKQPPSNFKPTGVTRYSASSFFEDMADLHSYRAQETSRGSPHAMTALQAAFLRHRPVRDARRNSSPQPRTTGRNRSARSLSLNIAEQSSDGVARRNVPKEVTQRHAECGNVAREPPLKLATSGSSG